MSDYGFWDWAWLILESLRTMDDGDKLFWIGTFLLFVILLFAYLALKDYNDKLQEQSKHSISMSYTSRRKKGQNSKKSQNKKKERRRIGRGGGR